MSHSSTRKSERVQPTDSPTLITVPEVVIFIFEVSLDQRGRFVMSMLIV